MTRLLVLGAGVPRPSRDRFGTSFLLTVDGDRLLFDCGPATTYKLVRAGGWPTEIDSLFFTHHHSDHNADYPCFVLCRWDQSIGTENPLSVFGPPPTAAFTDKLFGPDGAFAPDLHARINGPVSQRVHENRGGGLPRPPLKLTVTELQPGDEVSRNMWRVRTARAHHLEPHLQSLAYRVETPTGSVVILGDTGPCRTVAELAQGADVVVANCWDHQETMEANGEAPGQTGTLDAAGFAREAGAHTLVLAHLGAALAAPGSVEKAVADISKHYDGRIVVSHELLSLELS